MILIQELLREKELILWYVHISYKWRMLVLAGKLFSVFICVCTCEDSCTLVRLV